MNKRLIPINGYFIRIQSNPTLSHSIIFILLISIWCFSSLSTYAETIHTWDVYSLSFKSSVKINNPYLQVSINGKNDFVKVVFEGISGDAKDKKITTTGFWNGGLEWKINFTPPYSGTWKYNSISKFKSMNGKKGTIEVISWTEEEKKANPTRNGFIRVKKTGINQGHYFEYSDGRPFLWIADTWWNWSKKDIKFETFKSLVDDRAEKGFTVGQLFVPGNGWGISSSSLDSTFTVLDTEHLNKIEERIRYANSKGITIWMHAWWGGKNLDRTIGAEKMQRWWKYLINRFGAYNVIWVVAGEYNLYDYGGLGLEFWKNLGKLIKQEDPYDRITSIHNTPPFWEGGKEAPQWTTASVLHQESWLDYNQCQVGHGKFANEMIPKSVTDAYQCLLAKPIVVTEPWYEFTIGQASASDIRFGAWSAILSGAAGHTYGGGKIWNADVPESPGHRSYEPAPEGGTTLDYEGASSIKHLVSFMNKTSWWEMSPSPELITDYPQGFCLASPGKEYIVYLRYGGIASVHFGAKGKDIRFKYFWFDPATGKSYEPTVINGAEQVEFKCPIVNKTSGTETKDWVLFIHKID